MPSYCPLPSFRTLSAGLMLFAAACQDATDPTSVSTPATPALATTAALKFRQIDIGFDHACGTTTDSLAYCWGSGTVGELGTGTRITVRSTPIAVEGGRRWRHVTTGAAFSCGVTSDLKAWCWGGNLHGELGDGTTTDRLHMVQVAGGHKFRQIRAGANHACALDTSNVAWCWGFNLFGQVGDGSTAHRRTSPVRVAGSHTFVELSGRTHHTCGLTSAGKAWCWGRNESGALGDGTKTNRNVPKAVLGGLTFSQLNAGGLHTCAVTTGHKAYCWGLNLDGQLGNGTTDTLLTPHAVAGGQSFASVSAGSNHSCGVNLSGLGFCWGRNQNGQLGVGVFSGTHLLPEAVSGGRTWQFVRAGASTTCGVTTDRRGFCWGENNVGQLGNGTQNQSAVPVAVAPPN